MELSADIFQELTAGHELTAPTPGSDKRSVPRVQANFSVLIVLTGHRSSKPMRATVRDLSQKGIGIEFSEAIHVNDCFAVRLHRLDGTSLWIHCTAVRWSPLDKEHFSIGAKFIGVFDPSRSEHLVTSST